MEHKKVYANSSFQSLMDKLRSITNSSSPATNRQDEIKALFKSSPAVFMTGEYGYLKHDVHKVRAMMSNNGEVYFCFRDLCAVAGVSRGGCCKPIRMILKKEGLLGKGETNPARYVNSKAIKAWMARLKNDEAKHRIKMLLSYIQKPDEDALLLLGSIQMLDKESRRTAFAAWQSMVSRLIK